MARAKKKQETIYFIDKNLKPAQNETGQEGGLGIVFLATAVVFFLGYIAGSL